MTAPKNQSVGVVVYVPAAIHDKFKKACIDEKKTQKAVITEFIEAYAAPEDPADEKH